MKGEEWGERNLIEVKRLSVRGGRGVLVYLGFWGEFGSFGCIFFVAFFCGKFRNLEN